MTRPSIESYETPRETNVRVQDEHDYRVLRKPYTGSNFDRFRMLREQVEREEYGVK